MKIGIAQTKPVKGDVPQNIKSHQMLIDLALSGKADLLVFPELSITGYEPELAQELSTHPEDNRFDAFQQISDAKGIMLAIGVPTKGREGIYISLVLFAPRQPRQVYSKQHLHADEEPYFISGPHTSGLIGKENNIALAICYEISVPQHAEKAYSNGATIYIASVAKSVSGVEKAIPTLSDIAGKYKMTVLMANCVGYCDNFVCGGKSSVWNKQGVLVAQLDGISEGIIIFDTQTEEAVIKN